MGYADELFDLTDRVVLITGGSRGLGREMAFAAAHCGADVIIASRNLESCQATAAEVVAETGRVALAHQVHVGRWDELDGLVDAAYDAFGKVDVLVNNAGMSPLYESLGSVPEKLFDAVVNLNFKGPFRLSALIGERMVADGGGSIINISSSGSLRPDAYMLPYAAAKAGLNTLTEGFAKAFGPTVRVNTLMAGPFLTDISKAWGADTSRAFRSLPLQRAGDPREIVGAALFDVRRVQLHHGLDPARRRRFRLVHKWPLATSAAAAVASDSLTRSRSSPIPTRKSTVIGVRISRSPWPSAPKNPAISSITAPWHMLQIRPATAASPSSRMRPASAIRRTESQSVWKDASRDVAWPVTVRSLRTLDNDAGTVVPNINW